MLKWIKDKLFSTEPAVSAPVIIAGMADPYAGHVWTSGVTWSKEELSDQVGKLSAIQVRKDRVGWTCTCLNRATELADEPLAMALIERVLLDALGEPSWFHAADLVFTVRDTSRGISTDLLIKAQFGPRAASALRQRMPANPMNLYHLVLGYLSSGSSMTPALSTDQTVYQDLIYGRIDEAKARALLG